MSISDAVRNVISQILNAHKPEQREGDSFVFLAQVEVDIETGDIVNLYPMVRDKEDGGVQFVKLMRFTKEHGTWHFWKGEKLGQLRGMGPKYEMDALAEKETTSAVSE